MRGQTVHVSGRLRRVTHQRSGAVVGGFGSREPLVQTSYHVCTVQGSTGDELRFAAPQSAFPRSRIILGRASGSSQGPLPRLKPSIEC